MIKDNMESLRYSLFQEGIPFEIAYEITTRCNFRCTHCFNRENGYKEMGRDKLECLEKFIRNSKTMSLILTGGEFFLHPYAMEVLERMKRINNMEVIVYSNASLITDEIAKFLKENKIKLEVTLYGVSPKTYEAVTGDSKHYYMVQDGLSQLDRYGVHYKLKGIILRQNYDEADEIKRTIEEHNGEQTFINFELFGCKSRICESRLDDEQSLQLYRRFGVQRFVNKIPFGSCSAGKLQCCIRPDGSVVPCVGWNEVVIGNIENDSFKDISSSFDMKKLREKDIKCKKCELADFCDVCPMFFYQDTGSSSTVSPENCRHASFRQKVYLEGNCASGD